ncbi:MAG: hypothetical protein HZA89_03275 [Verrucomicrobia bacterium]|nr:hypothetical protein [Verrucomicrobiota bacterium]
MSAAVTVFENPALKCFLAETGAETQWAQVLLRRNGSGWELRHISDRDGAAAELRQVAPDGLRAVAQFTAGGAFRPLKAAPTLQRGWRCLAPDAAALETALNQLYPGALADWFAARASPPPVTHFREFTNRQSGMYRIAQSLTDAQAAVVIHATCDARLCLKRRLWTVDGLEADGAGEKSVIPCLEPCAVLLEAARKAARAEQQKKAPAGSSQTKD